MALDTELVTDVFAATTMVALMPPIIRTTSNIGKEYEKDNSKSKDKHKKTKAKKPKTASKKFKVR